MRNPTHILNQAISEVIVNNPLHTQWLGGRPGALPERRVRVRRHAAQSGAGHPVLRALAIAVSSVVITITIVAGFFAMVTHGLPVPGVTATETLTGREPTEQMRAIPGQLAGIKVTGNAPVVPVDLTDTNALSVLDERYRATPTPDERTG